ncbi:extracellular tyrosine-protein kinase PKDCC [Eucyclogobius newberryi]|uniref:extracellular tyrosine-protein kinase PKDCC n=1 Tax=Eucyclogobius newberryi TaxID=166745 RepID=UPI003B59593F
MGTSLRAAALLAFVVLSILVSLLISGVQQFGARVVSNVTRGEERLPEALVSQLNERRKEFVPLLFVSEDEELSDQALDSTWDHRVWDAPGGDMGCDSLVDMQALEVLGSGYTKLVVKANLAGGLAVALKLVNEQGIDMGKCVDQFHEPAACRQLVSYKLKKEMVLLKRLQHPNVIGLRGHCEGQHSAREAEGRGGAEGAEGGRLAVILEQGTPLQMIQLLQSPWEDRFRVCLDLVRLLHFLSSSPLGSVALLDFQPRQFVMVSGTLKLTDLDDVSAEPTRCQTSADCTLLFPQRNFTVPCVRGLCEGLNQKRNMYNAYRYFFTYLLPHQAPPTLTHLVDHIMNSTGELKSDINETLQAFEELLAQYQTGAHLDNLPASELSDYSLVWRVGVSGGEYRCWLSYSAQGCVLSVHSLREAAHICSSHSQCSSFSLTGQRTWSGRLLASFRSSSVQLIPDGTSDVYVKKITVSATTSL